MLDFSSFSVSDVVLDIAEIARIGLFSDLCWFRRVGQEGYLFEFVRRVVGLTSLISGGSGVVHEFRRNNIRKY